LGKSEGIGPYSNLYESINKRQKVYAKKSVIFKLPYDLIFTRFKKGTETLKMPKIKTNRKINKFDILKETAAKKDDLCEQLKSANKEIPQK
jgi:hypothetical protein